MNANMRTGFCGIREKQNSVDRGKCAGLGLRPEGHRAAVSVMLELALPWSWTAEPMPLGVVFLLAGSPPQSMVGVD